MYFFQCLFWNFLVDREREIYLMIVFGELGSLTKHVYFRDHVRLHREASLPLKLLRSFTR